MGRRFRVGRDKSCDVPIADESVSRLHAEFTVADGKILLSDCGSSNGTHVVRNNERRRVVAESALTAGDKVEFGTVTLTYEDLLSAAGGKNVAAAAPGRRLIRCSCGAVKPANAICPECKQ